MSAELRIAHRFRGPAHSGNGGYASGVLAGALARQIGADRLPAVEVTLRAPPPLDEPISFSAGDEPGTGRMTHGDTLVGSARALEAPLELELPTAPTLAEAEDATTRYAGRDHHILPECFVCGTRREHPDGLCIFAGPVAGRERELVAAPWRPDASLASDGEAVDEVFAWAALDCPSYFGLLRPGLFTLLGRITATIDGRLCPEETVIVCGWPLGSEGRKHRSGSAIFRADGGAPVAWALATWIEIDPSRIPPQS